MLAKVEYELFMMTKTKVVTKNFTAQKEGRKSGYILEGQIKSALS